MALLRKLFYRKPPDGLLEISERVYVFDICFTTDALEEDNYKIYIRGIISQLQDHFPDASFLVFNFREGQGQSQMASMLSEYDLTIMDYPRQYEGCPLLTMEVLHHFLRSCESWLQLGQQNLLIMHCERGGWPVLAFVLAALLIYRKQYSGEMKTLDMIYKQAPRELLHLLSPLNPIPSQLRYLQYVSRRNLASEWPSFDRALKLDCVILRYIPNSDGEGGCRPIFRVYGQDPFLISERAAKVLFSTPKRSKAVRYYKQAESELVKIDINCHIQGDIVLECISLHDDMEREEMIFRVAFNTAFIRSNILMLNRDDIDILWDSKEHFPKEFRAEIIFSEMDDATSIISVDFPFFEEKEGLSIDAFSKVQDLFSHVDWTDQRADAARTMLQQIGASNIVNEGDSSVNLDISSPQMRATSPKKSTHEEMNRAVSPTSPKSPTYWGLQIRLVPSEGPSPKRGFGRQFEYQDSPEKCKLPDLKSQLRDAFASSHLADKNVGVPSPPAAAAESSSLQSSGKLSRTSSKVGPSTNFTYPPTPPPPPLKENQSESLGVSIPPPPPPPLKDPPPPPPPPVKETSVPTPPPPPPTPPLKENSPVTACPPPPPLPSLPTKSSVSAPPPPPPPAPVSSSKVPSAPAPPPPPPASNGGPAPPPPPPASNGGPAPPPPPLGGSANPRNKALSRTISSRNNQGKKLKPLHWLKLTRAVQGSMWAEAQKMDEASKAPEIDIKELETLFSAAVPTSEGAGKAAVRSSAAPKSEKVQLIDHRRAYNCEIMLSKVKMPLPDLMGVVLALDESELDVDQVENIIKFCPTKEEAELLKGYTGDKEKLGKCEQFFLELIKVPRVESKLRVFSFKMQFQSQVSDLSRSLNVINSAAEEIRNSVKLKSIMQTILSLGNALNQGTARGAAIGFRLDSLLKLTDTRARNSRMTLMNYLCKVLADKLPEVLDFSKDLPNLEPASRVQLKFLAEEMQAISKGLEKVVQELASSENDGPVSEKFHRILKEFLCHAEGEVRWLASLYSAVGRNVDALILYFGEDPARCPFEQVISTLLNFVRMFNRAHEENCKQNEVEMKKVAAAESEKAKAKKESEQQLQNPSVEGSHVK